MGIVRFFIHLLLVFAIFCEKTGAAMYYIPEEESRYNNEYKPYEKAQDLIRTNDGYQQNEQELLKNRAKRFLNTQSKQYGTSFSNYDDVDVETLYEGDYDNDYRGNSVNSYNGKSYYGGARSYDDVDVETYYEGDLDYDANNREYINFGIDLSGFLEENDKVMDSSKDTSQISVSSKKTSRKGTNTYENDKDISDSSRTSSSAIEQKQTATNIQTSPSVNDKTSTTKNQSTVSENDGKTSTTKNQSTLSENVDKNESIQKALSENKSSIRNNQNKIQEQEEILQQIVQVISALQQQLDQQSKSTTTKTQVSNGQTSDEEDEDVLRKEHVKIVEETVNDLRSRGMLDEQKIKQLQFVAAGGGICSGCGQLKILTKLEGLDVGFCQSCLSKFKKQKVEFSKDVCIICKQHTSIKRLEGEFNAGICNNCYNKFKSNTTTGLGGVSLDKLGNQNLSALIQGATQGMGLNGEASALLGELLSKNISDKSDSSGKGVNQVAKSGNINGSPNASTTKNGTSQTTPNNSTQTMVFNEKGELVPLSSLKGTAAEFGYVKDANGKWVPAKSLEEATAAVKAANGTSQTASKKPEQMVFNEKGELVPLSSLKGTAAEFGYVKDANGKWVPAKSLEEATAAVKAANGTSQTASKKPEQMVFNEKGEVVPLSSLGGKNGYVKDANGKWVEAKSVDEAAAAVKNAINKGEILTDKNGKLVPASTLKDEAPYGYKKDQNGNWVKADSLQEGIAATTGALATLAANVVNNIISTASSLASSLNALKRSSNLALQQSLSTSLASTQNALNRSINESGLQQANKALAPNEKLRQKLENQIALQREKLQLAKEKLEEQKNQLKEAEAALSNASDAEEKQRAEKQRTNSQNAVDKQAKTVQTIEEKIKQLEGQIQSLAV